MQDGKIYMCVLRPMSDKRPASPQHGLDSNVDVSRVIRSESESTADTRVKCVPKDKDKDVSAVDEKGVLLDAGREVRVKLYMGQVSFSTFFPRYRAFDLQNRCPWVGSTLSPHFICNNRHLRRQTEVRSLIYYLPGTKLIFHLVLRVALWILKWTWKWSGLFQILRFAMAAQFRTCMAR